jgi:hypothetical protein
LGKSLSGLFSEHPAMPELRALLEVQRTLVPILDLCGTFAFALSGAMARY